jgi:hypothetical protein
MGELTPEQHQELGPILRKRLEYEELMFREWLEKQKRA